MLKQVSKRRASRVGANKDTEFQMKEMNRDIVNEIGKEFNLYSAMKSKKKFFRQKKEVREQPLTSDRVVKQFDNDGTGLQALKINMLRNQILKEEATKARIAQ